MKNVTVIFANTFRIIFATKHSLDMPNIKAHITVAPVLAAVQEQEGTQATD